MANTLRFLLVHLICVSSPLLAQESLVELAEKEDWNSFKVILKSLPKEKLDDVQPDGTTALHWCARHGHHESAKQLLEKGANPNRLNRYDVSPLSLASELGHASVAQELIKAGADVEQKRLGGERPLMLACRQGNPLLVQTLIDAGAQIDAKESRQQTALMWAAAAGNLQATKKLVEAGAKKTYHLKSGFSALTFAARHGHIDVASFLVKSGCDVNRIMKPKRTGGRHPRYGMSALMIAIESGHLQLALKLIQLGADPNDQRSGYAPLHAISWVRRANRGDNPDGDPPPNISGQIDSLKFVRELVRLGADVNLQLETGKPGGKAQLNPKGATPFLLACHTCDLRLMNLLLELKADPKLSNHDDCTPILAAAGVGVVAVGEYPGTESEACAAVRFLVEQGLPVNAVDQNGETAVHGAAYRAFPKVVETLAELGADPKIWNRKNRHGWTPHQIAAGSRPGSVKPSPETTRALDLALQARPQEPMN